MHFFLSFPFCYWFLLSWLAFNPALDQIFRSRFCYSLENTQTPGNCQSRAISPATTGNQWHMHPDKRLGLVIPTRVLAAFRQWPQVHAGHQPPACRIELLCPNKPSSQGKPPDNLRLVWVTPTCVSWHTKPFRGTNLHPAGPCSAPDQHTPCSHPSGSGAVAKMHAASPPVRTRFNGQNLRACLSVVGQQLKEIMAFKQENVWSYDQRWQK